MYLIKPKNVKQTLHHIPPQKYIGFVSSHFLVRGFCKNCQLYDESLFCCSSLLDGCKLLPFLFEIMLQHEKGITDILMSTSLNSSHRKNTVAQRIFTIDILNFLEQVPPLNSFRTFMYCHQRSQYMRPISKKNSFHGNYSRKYGSQSGWMVS